MTKNWRWKLKLFIYKLLIFNTKVSIDIGHKSIGTYNEKTTTFNWRDSVIWRGHLMRQIIDPARTKKKEKERKWMISINIRVRDKINNLSFFAGEKSTSSSTQSYGPEGAVSLVAMLVEGSWVSLAEPRGAAAVAAAAEISSWSRKEAPFALCTIRM